MSLDKLIIALQQIQAQHEDTDKMPVSWDNFFAVLDAEVKQVADGKYKVVLS